MLSNAEIKKIVDAAREDATIFNELFSDPDKALSRIGVVDPDVHRASDCGITCAWSCSWTGTSEEFRAGTPALDCGETCSWSCSWTSIMKPQYRTEYPIDVRRIEDCGGFTCSWTCSWTGAAAESEANKRAPIEADCGGITCGWTCSWTSMKASVRSAAE